MAVKTKDVAHLELGLIEAFAVLRKVRLQTDFYRLSDLTNTISKTSTSSTVESMGPFGVLIS